MTKKSTQKYKYFENKMSFYVEYKPLFIIFKGLLFAKNCLRPENAPLNAKCSFNKLYTTEKQLNDKKLCI